MALDPRLTPLTLPDGTEFPGTPQLLLSLIAAYMQITGIEDLGGVNYGPTTPSEANRDKPWFKTDGSYNPIGWYSWNGSEWVANLNNVPSGTSENRPGTATTGQLYLDTTINTLLMYERGAWRTASGSPGDCKFVNAGSLAAALTANPGWVEDTAAAGRVIAGATAVTGEGVNDTTGAKTHVLVEDELPSHSHSIGYITFNDGREVGNDWGLTPSGLASDGNQDTAATGLGDAHNNMQPTIYRWALVKS